MGRGSILLLEVQDSGRKPTSNAPIFHEVKNSRFLSQFSLPLVGKAIPIRVVIRSLIQVSELIELEPVHHSIRIRIFRAGQIVGDNFISIGMGRIIRID